ncbi:hypothetical protein [Amycolatopsis tucumanensis]|uniref:hypothetical protein n=1 Tax=Amycolatopsis tucumanensis TaxID=401106 RepID=UPI003D715150
MGEQDAQNWAARSHRELYEAVHTAAGPAAEAARAAMPEPTPFDLDETLERLFAHGGFDTLHEAAGDLRPAAERAWRAHDEAVAVMAAFAAGVAEVGSSIPQQTEAPTSDGGCSREFPPTDRGAGDSLPSASASCGAVPVLPDSDSQRSDSPVPSTSASSVLADSEFHRGALAVSSTCASPGSTSPLRRNDPGPSDQPVSAAAPSSVTASSLRHNDFRRSDPPVPPASAISGAAGGATHRPGATNSPRPPGMRTTGPAIPGSGGAGSLCPGTAGFGGAGSPGSGGGAFAIRFGEAAGPGAGGRVPAAWPA